MLGEEGVPFFHTKVAMMEFFNEGWLSVERISRIDWEYAIEYMDVRQAVMRETQEE